jgi:Phosphotransferase enzyme family
MQTGVSELLDLFRQEGSASYVVLSTEGRPRWVLPLAGRRVLRSAMAVYTPVTLRGLAAWHGARAVISCGFGQLLPGRRVSAHPPLLDSVSQLIGIERGHVAGASSFDGERGILCVIDDSGRIRAFVKLAWSDQHAESLRRESDTLDRLKGMSMTVRLPRVIFSGELEDFATLVITPVLGRPRLRPGGLGTQLVQASATIFRNNAGKRPLAAALPATEAEDPEWSRLLGETRAAIEPWAERSVPVGLVHGDFAPWNLLEAGRSIGIVDWEEARFDGLPFWDLWHYAVQTAALTRRPRSMVALHRAIRGEGPLWHALQYYASRVDLPVELGRMILPLYLAATGPQPVRGGGIGEHDQSDSQSFRRRLLEEALEVLP